MLNDEVSHHYKLYVYAAYASDSVVYDIRYISTYTISSKLV